MSETAAHDHAQNGHTNGTGLAPPPPPEVVPKGQEVAVRRPEREIRVVRDPIHVLDTARFEHMQRIATAMASMTVGLPDCLWKTKDGDGNEVHLPMNAVVANCFLVVNQAVRWEMDPFAVAQCVSVVHGKLCYEGKVIAAAIEARLGLRLKYKFNDAKGQELGVTVYATFPGDDEPTEIEGRVKDWHKGPKSPWADEGAWKRQLRYRGAREWARAHAPGVILGVYAPDEFDDEPRDITPKNISPVQRPNLAPPSRPSSLQPPARLDTPATSSPASAVNAGEGSQSARGPAASTGAPRSENAVGQEPTATRDGSAPERGDQHVEPEAGEQKLEMLQAALRQCETLDSMLDVWAAFEGHHKSSNGTVSGVSKVQWERAKGIYFDAQQRFHD